MAEAAKNLWGALDLAVFEKDAAGGFRLVASPPSWFQDFHPSQEGDRIDGFGELFPFLDYFIEEGAKAWASDAAERVVSGPWNETAPDGRERPLRAIALRAAGRCYLLVELLGQDFLEQREILQRAQESAVAYQRFAKIGEALLAAEGIADQWAGGETETMFRLRRDGRFLDVTPSETNGVQKGWRNTAEVLPSTLAKEFHTHVEAALEKRKPLVFRYTAEAADGPKRFEARLLPCDADEVLVLVEKA